jgi:hypothetical protein
LLREMDLHHFLPPGKGCFSDKLSRKGVLTKS